MVKMQILLKYQQILKRIINIYIYSTCIKLMESESKKQIMQHLLSLEIGKTEEELIEDEFDTICGKIPMKSVVPCFILVLEVLTKIIHTHYLICQYHINPFEEGVDNQKLHDRNIDAVSNEEIKEAQNNIISTKNFKYNQGEFLQVLKELIESKTEIWEEASRIVHNFILNVGINNARYKIEHWLALIDNSDIFCSV